MKFARKHIPYFRGEFMRDSLPKNKYKNERGIINLVSSAGGETH